MIECKDATEAEDVPRTGKPVDAVFSDINTPGPLAGATFAAWISGHCPPLAVLLTSRVPETALALRTTPLRRFVIKPYHPFDLLI